MKNRPPKTGSQSISSAFETVNVKTTQKKTKIFTKAVKTMAHHPVKPPSRVWEKIQAILDEQDNRRNDADQIIASSFGLNAPELKRKKVY
jgi:hypothetical protein